MNFVAKQLRLIDDMEPGIPGEFSWITSICIHIIY